MLQTILKVGSDIGEPHHLWTLYSKRMNLYKYLDIGKSNSFWVGYLASYYHDRDQGFGGIWWFQGNICEDESRLIPHHLRPLGCDKLPPHSSNYEAWPNIMDGRRQSYFGEARKLRPLSFNSLLNSIILPNPKEKVVVSWRGPAVLDLHRRLEQTSSRSQQPRIVFNDNRREVVLIAGE
jgi:hypothetical protein